MFVNCGGFWACDEEKLKFTYTTFKFNAWELILVFASEASEDP